ncbi:MAG: hypothetical protein LBV45_02690 [Xanthomonadaceae bacterium]|jgi:hypothetical protein|nr:hypothetical protein [Xanthomonadaceae bacterium]
MSTRRGRGSKSGQRIEASRLCRDLKAEGFEVACVEVEASSQNADVPRCNDEPVQPGCRSKSRITLLLSRSPGVLPPEAVARRHTARVPHKAVCMRGDDGRKRFMAQQYPPVDDGVRQCLNRSLETLMPLDRGVPGSRSGCITHDGRIALDEGWIEGGTRR